MQFLDEKTAQRLFGKPIAPTTCGNVQVYANGNAVVASELTTAAWPFRQRRRHGPTDEPVHVSAVVKPADPILVVVPTGGTMIVDTQVLNRDVGQLRTGQAVAIKLEAFCFTRYGTIPGRLIGLSKDAVQDEKRGLIYQARIAIDCDMQANSKTVTPAQQSTR